MFGRPTSPRRLDPVRWALIASAVLVLAVSPSVAGTGPVAHPGLPGPASVVRAPAHPAPGHAVYSVGAVAVHYSRPAAPRPAAPQVANTSGIPGCPANSTLSSSSSYGYQSLTVNNTTTTTLYDGPAVWCFSGHFNPNGSYTYCLYWSLANSSTLGNLSISCQLFPYTNFGAPCAPPVPNATVGAFGLNLSVATTPSNGSGSAPVNFTWNATVGGAGLPPYQVVVFLGNEQYSFLTTGATGSVVLTATGLYEVNVMAFDSTCTQSAFLRFPIQVTGPYGALPVPITPTASSPNVPANVTYAVNTSALPPGWTVEWDTPGIFASPSGVHNNSSWNNGILGNYTYFFPGTYSASACFVQPNGVVYSCGTSANVIVGGASPVTTTVTVAPGPYPTNVTYTATLNPGVWLPANTTLYLFADNLSGVGNWNVSSGTNVSLTIRAACGYPFTPYVPVAGNCTWPAVFSLHGLFGGLDAGFLGLIEVDANLTANGSPSTWLPTLSVSYGPTNGSLPLNFTLNLSAAGGVAPYYYSYSLFGRTSGAANATFLPTQGASGWGWNGSTIRTVLPLNHTGVYWTQVFVADREAHFVVDSLPLIVLGNVSPLFPLRLHATTLHDLVGASGGAETIFLAAVDGGRAPYTVEWSFGDGAVASSAPGAPVWHNYSTSGTFYPVVTVTDALGHTVTTGLGPVVVHVPAPSSPPTRSTGAGGPLVTAAGVSFAWVPVLLAALAAGGLAIAGWRQVRREVRREGEELLAGAVLLTGDGPESPKEPPSGA